MFNMKLGIKLAAFTLILGTTLSSFAGNPDRIGQAGAGQLVMNGYAFSSGMGWASVPGITGVEAIYMNLGGLARVSNTELLFSNTNWLMGTDVSMNSFGFAQPVGSSEGVLGFSLTTINIGEIDITTTGLPEGGIGTVNPRLSNLALAYSKKFTDAIAGGVLVRVHNESIPNAHSTGVAIDAGISYYATADKRDPLKKDDIKFGISLKNVGPDTRFSGDGLSFKATNNQNGQEMTFNQRAQGYGLPTLINIGGSYDFRLDDSKESYYHRLTSALNFTSYAYQRNQFTLGFEYAFKKTFMVRMGYAFEDEGFNYDTRTSVHTGLSAGVTYEFPLSKKGSSKFAVDYSYRDSNPFSGTHSVGIRLKL